MEKREIFKGIPASPYVAIGRVLVLGESDFSSYHIHIEEEEKEAEVQRFNNAVDLTRKQLENIRDKLAGSLGEDHAYIIDTQLLILDDDMFIEKSREEIREKGKNAEWALESNLEAIKEKFKNLEDHYFADKINDIDDVGQRILQNLTGIQPHDLSELKKDTIIVSHKLTPSQTAQIQKEKVVGFCTDVGGLTSHTAILAKSMEIPAVIGMHDFTSRVKDDHTIIVDGIEGKVILNPNEADLNEYRLLKSELENQEKELLKKKDEPAVTGDGTRIKLFANIEFPREVESAREHGAEGIGLYRSEFVFLNAAPDMPTEEEQFETYRSAVESSPDGPIAIRTFDLGGEKFFHKHMGSEPDFNPVLGLRAIRYGLKNRQMLKTQIRAILRVSDIGKVKLLVPMITNVEEIRKFKSILEEIKEELRNENISFDENIPLGIMIEVPSAARTADILAEEVDFFSVGTNDLIQYSLAIERGNEDVAHLYNPLHPYILRILEFVADTASQHDVDLAICGEMAGDPLYIPVLLGLGYRDLSMTSHSVPHIKRIVKKVTIKECKEFVKEMKMLSVGSEIQEMARRKFNSISS